MLKVEAAGLNFVLQLFVHGKQRLHLASEGSLFIQIRTHFTDIRICFANNLSIANGLTLTYMGTPVRWQENYRTAVARGVTGLLSSWPTVPSIMSQSVWLVSAYIKQTKYSIRRLLYIRRIYPPHSEAQMIGSEEVGGYWPGVLSYHGCETGRKCQIWTSLAKFASHVHY